MSAESGHSGCGMEKKQFFCYHKEMMQDPQPTSPLPENSAEKDLLVLREDELRHVTELGQEQIAKEVALHEALEQKRLGEEKKSKKAALGLETQRREKSVHAKKFRTVRLMNEKEIAADKERQRKLEEREAARKKKHEEELKKQNEYFHDLRLAAGSKIAREHKENELKKLIEEERKKATRVLDAAVAAATEKERLAGQDIEQEVRARKSLIDMDTRAALYKWEAEERMKTQEIENDMHRRLSEIREQEKTAYEQQGKKASLELFMRSKRRHIDAEMTGKKQSIEAEDRRKRASVDTEAQEKRREAARDRQHAIRLAEQRYGECLNDIAREYVTKHYDRKG